MDPKDVNWCQTPTDAEGTFDLSLTQCKGPGDLRLQRGFIVNVLDSLSWDRPTTPLGGPEEQRDPNEGWYCLKHMLATSTNYD